MSRLLPRETLNAVYTVILVMNCWTTPLLQRVYRDNKPLERLLVVLCDLVLDFFASIAVPAALALGYLQQYDADATDFVPWTLYYDDVWLLNFLNEMPLVVFGSWLEAASRLVFSLGLLVALDDVKALVTRLPRVPHAQQIRQSTQRKATLKASVLDRLTAPALQNRVCTWAHRVMVLWGLGIAILHVEAALRPRPLHCSLPLKPWLVTQPACAVVTIDCSTDPSLSGDAIDFDAVYGRLDAGSVEYVIFRHCPRVALTPHFLTFHNLYGVKTYNSTLASWPLAAALTATAHPRVRFAFFILTQFANATLSAGLCHAQFPPTLMGIEIAGSNLHTLPSKLPWPPLMTIYMEFAQLDHVPRVLLELVPSTLSLAFNQIEDLEFALSDWRVMDLIVRGNPIQRLPDVVQWPAPTSRQRLLAFEYTQIQALPALVSQAFLDQIRIEAAQSPLCTDLRQSDAWRDERPWLSTVAWSTTAPTTLDRLAFIRSRSMPTTGKQY